jgi:hypothetical protein
MLLERGEYDYSKLLATLEPQAESNALGLGFRVSGVLLYRFRGFVGHQDHWNISAWS